MKRVVVVLTALIPLTINTFAQPEAFDADVPDVPDAPINSWILILFITSVIYGIIKFYHRKIRS